jgi:hypothetical protein
MRSLFAVLLCALLAACQGGRGTTTQRETGYKGKARLDAYLAAGRFLEKSGYQVESKPGWPELGDDVAVVIIPASVISTRAYARELDQWVADGGHLMCLVERAESYHDDWSRFAGLPGDDQPAVPEPLGDWLRVAGLEVERGDKIEATRLRLDGERYEVFAEASAGVKVDDQRRRLMGQADYGEGRITVMADARPFRNRYIGDHDHAELLLALVASSPYEGSVVIVRDAALSLGSLLWEKGWPALAGLLAVTVFWLWKNMPRFGPLRRGEPPTTTRDYDHHLEALGDFQWRLDKGAALLRPLRDSVLERAQRLAAAGHRDADLFDWIARRAGVTRERAERAMTHEHPGDATSFTRVLADLQKIHLSLS